MTAKRNILIALMLLLIVAVSACALVACNNTTAEISGVQIATDDNGDPIYGGGSYVMPEGMAFSAAASTAAETDTSVTLTANYEPAGTSNKQTNWSVSFKNPSSSWANGKTVTDYVTVESTGTNTAKVACVNAFGEQIIVKATSAADPSVSATTTVDFEKKLEDVKFTLYLNDSVVGSAYHNDLASGGSSSYFTMGYNENSDSAITTYPYYDVVAKIDATGDPDDEYRVAIEPVFTAYTIDKTFPAVYRHVSTTTTLGEYFAEIEGTDNYAVPSDLFSAPGYWTSGYGAKNEVLESLLVAASNLMQEANFLTYTPFSMYCTQANNLLESGDFEAESISVSAAVGMCLDVYNNKPADLTGQSLIEYVSDELNSVFGGSLTPSTHYDGATVDLGDYSTPEEYFTNKNAKSCTRITLGSHGRGYLVSFKFNASSL